MIAAAYIGLIALVLGQTSPQPVPIPVTPAQPTPSVPPGIAELSGPVITLEEAIKIAQANNLDLKAAQARLEQAHELSSKAWSYYLPQLTASGSYTRNNTEAPVQLSIFNDQGQFQRNVKVNLQELNQFAGRISVSQALIAPPLWPAIKNAYLAEKVAELSTESVRREVLFGVAQAYYGAAALKEALAVRKRVLDNNIAHEKDAVIRVQAGAVQRIIMVRAKMDRATAEQDLLSAQYAYASAKIAIGTLLDRKESFEVSRPEPAPLPPNPVSLEEGILERPDLKAAQGNLELASRAHHTTWLKYLPSVGVSAAYQASNTQGFTGKYDSWAAILGVSWTLWDGGLRESEWRENEAKLVEAKANLRKSEITARDEVRRAQLELESARANLAKSDEQLKLAQENMQLAQVNFEGGAATQLEISDANATLTSAEIGHVAETLNAQLAALKLLKAAGRFNP